MVNDSERTAAEPVVQSSLCWATELLKTHMLTACQKTKNTLPTARTRPSYAGHRKNDLHTAAKTFLWMPVCFDLSDQCFDLSDQCFNLSDQRRSEGQGRNAVALHSRKKECEGKNE